MEEEGSTGAAAVLSGDEAAHEDESAVASWFVVDEETAMELSKLLDLFETPPPPMKVRFIDDPYSSPVIFQSSSAFVTINGNEESCGSSFSDSDSSVMASIDVGGARRCGGALRFDSAEAREWLTEGSVGEADVDVELDAFLTDDCDYHDVGEDAMWVEFLGKCLDNCN
ncbi:hypothetical protein DH2020_026642 [Rehmannia glutinosa]|uniref:Uncharacterized protein n=1 Tax=Rehmannia glutinosa TaxID=99300 RepID=A0ABR0VWG8_REHGL